MSKYVFHANDWTVNFEPISKGSGTWASKWTAARGGPTSVGQIQRDVEIRSSGEIALHGSATEAANRAKEEWLNDHGPIRHEEGAAFFEPAVFGKWHIGLGVWACDMTHTAPIWSFSGNAVQAFENREEKFSSGSFRFATVEEAFADAERLLSERYGPRDE
ncbi:hypothetical protein ABY44_39240 [Burkholderia sp. ZZQ-2]|uniref:hypothetical protein n=1 Tax=Burkholderia sp. ZZQ-2 TaxID=1661766 RepID=UPI003D701701